MIAGISPWIIGMFRSFVFVPGYRGPIHRNPVMVNSAPARPLIIFNMMHTHRLVGYPSDLVMRRTIVIMMVILTIVIGNVRGVIHYGHVLMAWSTIAIGISVPHIPIRNKRPIRVGYAVVKIYG
jgi:hypothetical protein